MSKGYSGLFSGTKGFNKAISLATIYIDESDKTSANIKKVKEEKGFIDIAIHGATDYVVVRHNGKIEKLNQRDLAKMIKKDLGNKKCNIRLLSCNTGQKQNGFAQNLANKMGVKVKAPSDTLWVFPNGKMVIGQSQFKNTGKWNIYYPGGNKNERNN